jgi:hypothetical protein
MLRTFVYGANLMARTTTPEVPSPPAQNGHLNGHTRRWGTIPMAADHASLSVKSIRRMIEMGSLTGHRPTGGKGRIIIDLRELDAVLASS